MWDYPTHGFIVCLEEAQELGLNVEAVGDDCAAPCTELVRSMRGCVGVLPDSKRPKKKATKKATRSSGSD